MSPPTNSRSGTVRSYATAQRGGASRIRLRLLERWLVTHLLPEALLYPLWHWYTARIPRSVLATASDHRVIATQEEMRLEVYWVNRQLGPGPGASLYVLGDEVLRLDCFGAYGQGGHYHINPRQVRLNSLEPARLFFPAGSHEDHIERAAFELKKNLPAALSMNRNARIRRIEVDSTRLVQAANNMQKAMLDLLEKHREELIEGGYSPE